MNEESYNTAETLDSQQLEGNSRDTGNADDSSSSSSSCESDSDSSSSSDSNNEGSTHERIPAVNLSHTSSDSKANDDNLKNGTSDDSSENEDNKSCSFQSSSSNSDDHDDYKPNSKKAPKVRIPTKNINKNSASWYSEQGDSDSSEFVSSDSDGFSTKNNKKYIKKKHKTKKNSSSSYESDEDNKRHSTRRNAASISYKEDSEIEKTDSEDILENEYMDDDNDEQQHISGINSVEEKCETIERVLNIRLGKKGHTGNQTTIYAENQLEDDGEIPDNESEREEQFLIKWKGWSHIHNTWESEASLQEQKVKGLKKLENYKKKNSEIELWRQNAGPEDIDYFECQLELQTELLKTYNNVDRIISSKTDGTCEYLCKWESLPYSEATWEDFSLITKKWPEKISNFTEREKSQNIPTRHAKVLKTRPKFMPMESQPSFITQGLALRDYQVDGINWLIHSWCKNNSVILADEMGLGKTIQTICFLYYLFQRQHLYGPFLCIVPLSTMTAWQREFQIWAPDINVVTYLGDVQSREIIRQFELYFNPADERNANRLKFNAILTTYEILLKDKMFLGSIQWTVLLVDEAHRLKNDDSLLYKTVKDFDTNHRLLITGTPLQNSLKELWALLHFIMPSKFETWEDFEHDNEDAADKGYTNLHKQLEPFILRRVKKDVEKSLPAKVEQILRVEMTSAQKQYYKWILTKNFNALRKGTKGSTSTFLNIVIELKKCCNHGALIRPAEFELLGLNQELALQRLLKGSGKLVLLDKLLCRLKETGHRVLIFSQMVRMLDILADYLQKRHWPFQRLDGSIKGEIRRQALDHFNAENSQDFCFLLSTRAGGLGINLATADTVIIFDSDWNPQNDLQAQARAHRIGQKNQVNIYRLVTARSVEEEIVERAKQKMVLDHLVIQRMDTTGRTVLDKNSGGSKNTSTPFNKDDLSAILKFGAEELFKDDQDGEGDDMICDIDDILRRAELRNDDPAMVGDDLLSAFKVASFAAFEEEEQYSKNNQKSQHKNNAEEDGVKDWDQIIPENYRKIIENEEKNKEMKDLYLPPRRQVLNKKDKCDSDAHSDGGDGSEFSQDDDPDDSKPKKRGRPTMKEKIKGFNDTEIRRFIKSYKKFPNPLERLEDIACDAELQEKPLNDLKYLGNLLHERCLEFVRNLSNDVADPPSSEKSKNKNNRSTFSLKVGGVSFNAKTVVSSEDELSALAQIIPKDVNERLSWSLDLNTRPANFDIEWSIKEDTKLLCGIYQYGIGSWESIKVDPHLSLSDKILPANVKKKPQSKHLQSRSEYLLKVIKKNLESSKNNNTKKKTKAQRKRKTNAKVDEEKPQNIAEGIEAEKVVVTSDVTSKPGVIENSKKKKSKKNKKNVVDKPMHFTANNEPRALEVLGDLDPSIFNECKEKMRPVKKSLKALDKPDSNLSSQQLVDHTRQCLLSIGKQIDICLKEYKDPDKIKEWRSNLWYFVSKFTEFDAKKLFKLYKHALKKSDKSENDKTPKRKNLINDNSQQSSDSNFKRKRLESENKDQTNKDRIPRENRLNKREEFTDNRYAKNASGTSPKTSQGKRNFPDNCVGGYNESERWRYGEYSKRYDNNYSNRPPQGYSRDYRERDNKLEHRADKRSRYSQAPNYPYNNYENIHMHYHYRDGNRYAPEWTHDKRTGDYRRSNYDRRSSNS